MNKPLLTIFFVAISSIFVVGNINFSADSLTLELPSTIIASGNTTFSRQNINISSNYFSYDTKSQLGKFEKKVLVTYEKSKLQGNLFTLNVNDQIITGEGNIVFNAKDLIAYSNQLIITNFEVLRLKNNVKVIQNGSQIRSDELLYNLKTDTILSNQRVKLIIEE